MKSTKNKTHKKKANLKTRKFGAEMSASMNFSSYWQHVKIADQSGMDYVKQRQNRLAVSYAIIGGKSIPRVSNIVLDKQEYYEFNHKKILCQPFMILNYPPKMKNSQEMLLYWVNYTTKIGDTGFRKKFDQYPFVQLIHHYLVFKDTVTVKVLDLNATNEIVRINYGKAYIFGKDSYVMKFIATFANNVDSEFLVVSDTVIKSPSHAKITELTDEQYNTMKREKLFKQ